MTPFAAWIPAPGPTIWAVGMAPAARSLLLPLALLAAGAEEREPPRYRADDAPVALQWAASRAKEAIRAAACDAERRFGEGDPDANASHCEGAAAVDGVLVGRTSARLRNPRNAPPEWARAYVEATDGKKAVAVAAVVFDLGDRVGLLRPIEVRQRCLGCHARPEKLAEGTRSWLSRAYPVDRALGYELGDLRGFWWAQAPLH